MFKGWAAYASAQVPLAVAGFGVFGCGVGRSGKPLRDLPPLGRPEEFRDALTAWFRECGKEYPWRRTRDPYRVLVSEIMLQQTRISTVIEGRYFERFLEVFPDVGSLAGAADGPLLKAWEGLGYYRRVRMLRETARAVVADHGGCFPSDECELLRLPGIGPYTAAALRAFAFGLSAVVVDGNVARVLARIMDWRESVDGGEGMRRVKGWAARLADPVKPWEYHSALMELGQTHCRPAVVECGVCPVARFCKTRAPLSLPVKVARPRPERIEEHALWVRDRSGRVLLHCEAGARRTGLWKLPLRDASDLGGVPVVYEASYGITRFRVSLAVYGVDAGVVPELREGDAWISVEDLPGLAMAAPFRRAVERLLASTAKGM